MSVTAFVPLLKCAGFHCSRQGALHKEAKDPLPCQDSSWIVEGTNFVMAAAADGHGDARRSLAAGGRICGEVGLRRDAGIVPPYEAESIVHLKRNFKSQFADRLTKRWREQVMTDYRQQAGFPLDASIDSVPDDLHQVYSRYGTTLLAVMVVPGTICMAQLGDGDIVLLKEGGGRDIPFPTDENLVGGDTFSFRLVMRKIIGRPPPATLRTLAWSLFPRTVSGIPIPRTKTFSSC